MLREGGKVGGREEEGREGRSEGAREIRHFMVKLKGLHKDQFLFLH